MPEYFYQLWWQISFYGPVEAKDPLQAVEFIRQRMDIKQFRGELYERRGLRFIPLPNSQYGARFNHKRLYAKNRKGNRYA